MTFWSQVLIIERWGVLAGIPPFTGCTSRSHKHVKVPGIAEWGMHTINAIGNVAAGTCLIPAAHDMRVGIL